MLSNYPYNINRSDRTHSPGGGVCILSRYSVNVIAVSIPQHVNCFDICAVDTVGVDTSVRFITVYRPPSSDTDIDAVAAVKDLINCLNKLCDVDCTVVIVGDFNFPNIDWSDPVLVSDSDRCSVGLLFAQFAQYAM